MIGTHGALQSLGHHRLEELKGRRDPEALRTVAKEMEALFAYEMLKAMRQTSSSSQGLGADCYTSMFDMEVARVLSERGLGIREMLLKYVRDTRDTHLSGMNAETTGPLEKPPAAPPVGRHVEVTLPVPVRLSLEGKESTECRVPVEGRISSGFGLRRHPILKDYRMHQGIDIAAPEGSEVRPLRKGKVVFSGRREGYGNTVIIDHGDGVMSKYAHTMQNLVKVGDLVDQSTIIARVGSTGRSTGPHLHLEVVNNGERVDPLQVLTSG